MSKTKRIVDKIEAGMNIEKLRKKLKLTQEGLAKALNDIGYPTSLRTIARWEARESLPSNVHLAGLKRLQAKSSQ